MKEDNFRVVIVIIVIVVAIAFLAIVADVMKQHSAIPWFGFGILAVLVLEALIYGVYRLVKYLRNRN